MGKAHKQWKNRQPGKEKPLKGPCYRDNCNFQGGEKFTCKTCERLSVDPPFSIQVCFLHREEAIATIKKHALIKHPVNIVRAAQENPGGMDADGNGRDRSQNGTAFRTWRRYLCEMGLVDAEENELLQWVYGVASAKGSHHGVTDEAWTRLVRRVVLATSHYLLHRYAAWKRDGRAVAAPIQRRPLSAGRRWLQGVIRGWVRKV